MDTFFKNEEENQRNLETRWDRIEKRHIHSAIVYEPTDATAEICKNFIQNKEFVTNNQLKTLMGDKSKKYNLDPNLVMDLRHSKVRRRNKSATSAINRRAKHFVDERMHVQKMFELNREISKYKQKLTKIRPKSNDFHTQNAAKKCYSARSDGYLKIAIPCGRGDDGNDEVNARIENGDDDLNSQESCPVENKQHLVEDDNELYDDNQETRSLSPLLIPSQCLLDESDSMNGIDVDLTSDQQPIPSDFESTSPCSSHTELKTVIRPQQITCKSHDDFEFIVKPMIMVNIQDTIRSNIPNEFGGESNSKSQAKPFNFIRESKIDVNQHMSILIKKLSSEIVDQKSRYDSYMDESTVGNHIIKEVFDKKTQDNFLVLQKYFLRWIHFNTIEKLKRRNPTQTRLQKMEAFLQNITLERKRALNKLRRPGNMLAPCHNAEYRRMTLHDPNMESPRLLIRTYNNKLKTQQDIIELQKIKLQRQQRIITEMKLSKLLEDTNDAENHLKEELSIVAKTGCQNSRSKAKCLQIAGNLKDKDDDMKSELQAKGITAPKFLIEMQARALEREMRHQEAQRRREALEREKEALKMAAEEEKRRLDEEAKRERIREYWRKRRLEKEIEAKKALERMRFLTNLELAKAFNRSHLLKWAMEKFKNIVRWKHRNKHVSTELRHRMLYRDYFHRWKKHTNRIWEERKAKADACYHLHCKLMAWAKWQECYMIMRRKVWLADDWFHLRLSERVFRAWNCVTAQTRLIFEIKTRQAEAHFNWYMKWKVLEHWRRLHAILKIEKDTEERRERWRSKIYELIPDYTPNVEFI
ncbi:uncharacterized protein LOC116340532 [Contarinia nasturtii]|uniref:uncharacterized protein LOC116340532 n=1 Tax=Contarinia nasturtii TaxID=265458 RepID=UPI0012D3FB7B|nr:uncharacterized protein LOC116340532 [Contarinia nasturtii]